MPLSVTATTTVAFDAEKVLQRARQTIATERAGIDLLAESLDGQFAAAVARLLGLKGRVIVTGMGKSGHIARKIAATLASTGTPAYFVHPAEASHGDLGMISVEDAIIALSNSGESPELSSLITYARRADIPIIAICRESDSSLGRAATHFLRLPAAAEACPLAMAPTTSSTLSLVLGDALAMALLEARGFTRADFGQLHPGGKLGSQLRRLAEVAREAGHGLPVIAADQPMRAAVLAMTEGRLGCVAVTDASGRLTGVITDGDLRRALGDAALLDRQAQAVMTADPLTLPASALAVDALALMESRRITVLFLVDEQKRPTAAIHVHDLLQIKVA